MDLPPIQVTSLSNRKCISYLSLCLEEYCLFNEILVLSGICSTDASKDHESETRQQNLVSMLSNDVLIFQ